ncbi:MAG: hypothetical protein ACREF4_05020, partial [Gammaproteobacteria bacterium]
SHSNTDVRFSPLSYQSLSAGGPVALVPALWAQIPLNLLPQPRTFPKPPIDPADRLDAFRRLSGVEPEPALLLDEGPTISAFWNLAEPLHVDDIRLVRARWNLAVRLEAADLRVAADDGRKVSFAVPGTRSTATFPVVDVRAFLYRNGVHRIEQFLEPKGRSRR